MKSIPESKVVQLCDNREADYRPLIPGGLYSVAFDSYETSIQFGKSPKLALNFHVIDPGQYFNTPLSRWYSVKWVGKRPGRNGTFKPKGQTSIFLIEYLRCFPERGRPRRLDRVPMGDWPRHAYKVKVANVTKNSKQVDLPAALQYSKIETILGVAETWD